MHSVQPADRAAAYSQAFPKYPPLAVHGAWLYGIWEIGNDYKGSGFYGSYPPGYVKRIKAILPEGFEAGAKLLHLFSGSLGPEVGGVRVDCNPSNHPDVVADATKLPFADASFDMIMADPPYSPLDAQRYGTPMVNRRLVMREAARVLRPGCHMVWLDTVKPMYRKLDWRLWGEIGILRSTNHRGRFVFIFEREELR